MTPPWARPTTNTSDPVGGTGRVGRRAEAFLADGVGRRRHRSRRSVRHARVAHRRLARRVGLDHAIPAGSIRRAGLGGTRRATRRARVHLRSLLVDAAAIASDRGGARPRCASSPAPASTSHGCTRTTTIRSPTSTSATNTAWTCWGRPPPPPAAERPDPAAPPMPLPLRPQVKGLPPPQGTTPPAPSIPLASPPGPPLPPPHPSRDPDRTRRRARRGRLRMRPRAGLVTVRPRSGTPRARRVRRVPRRAGMAAPRRRSAAQTWLLTDRAVFEILGTAPTNCTSTTSAAARRSPSRTSINPTRPGPGDVPDRSTSTSRRQLPVLLRFFPVAPHLVNPLIDAIDCDDVDEMVALLASTFRPRPCGTPRRGPRSTRSDGASTTPDSCRSAGVRRFHHRRRRPVDARMRPPACAGDRCHVRLDGTTLVDQANSNETGHREGARRRPGQLRPPARRRTTSRRARPPRGRRRTRRARSGRSERFGHCSTR